MHKRKWHNEVRAGWRFHIQENTLFVMERAAVAPLLRLLSLTPDGRIVSHLKDCEASAEVYVDFSRALNPDEQKLSTSEKLQVIRLKLEKAALDFARVHYPRKD